MIERYNSFKILPVGALKESNIQFEMNRFQFLTLFNLCTYDLRARLAKSPNSGQGVFLWRPLARVDYMFWSWMYYGLVKSFCCVCWRHLVTEKARFQVQRNLKVQKIKVQIEILLFLDVSGNSHPFTKSYLEHPVGRASISDCFRWCQSFLTGFYNGGLWEINIWNDFAKMWAFLYKIIWWKNTSQRGDPNYVLLFTLYLRMA